MAVIIRMVFGDTVGPVAGGVTVSGRTMAAGNGSLARFVGFAASLLERARWTVEQIPGGYKVLDASGQSLAYVYGRETKGDADIANVLTMDEARRIANIAKLPNILGHGQRAASPRLRPSTLARRGLEFCFARLLSHTLEGYACEENQIANKQDHISASGKRDWRGNLCVNESAKHHRDNCQRNRYVEDHLRGLRKAHRIPLLKAQSLGTAV